MEKEKKCQTLNGQGKLEQIVQSELKWGPINLDFQSMKDITPGRVSDENNWNFKHVKSGFKEHKYKKKT